MCLVGVCLVGMCLCVWIVMYDVMSCGLSCVCCVNGCCVLFCGVLCVSVCV